MSNIFICFKIGGGFYKISIIPHKTNIITRKIILLSQYENCEVYSIFPSSLSKNLFLYNNDNMMVAYFNRTFISTIVCVMRCFRIFKCDA